MNKYIKENLFKNLIILIIMFFAWPILSNSLAQIQTEQIGNFLSTISMLLVTVCFANFAFTYEKSKFRTEKERLLSHFSTGIFMLLIALFLEIIVIIMSNIYPFFHYLIFIFSILLYTGIILYDFWDVLRAEE